MNANKLLAEKITEDVIKYIQANFLDDDDIRNAKYDGFGLDDKTDIFAIIFNTLEVCSECNNEPEEILCRGTVAKESYECYFCSKTICGECFSKHINKHLTQQEK